MVKQTPQCAKCCREWCQKPLHPSTGADSSHRPPERPKLSLLLHPHCNHNDLPKDRDLGLLCSPMSHQRPGWGGPIAWRVPILCSPCIHTMPFAIWLAFISLKRQILLPSLLNLGCPCDFFCPAENKQEKKSMHHSEPWLQKALPVSTSPLTLCHHHEKDILKPVCLSQNKDESHGGKARLPRLFQPRPSKMSQQTDSGPTDTQVNLGKPAGHSSWPGPKLS